MMGAGELMFSIIASQGRSRPFPAKGIWGIAEPLPCLSFDEQKPYQCNPPGELKGDRRSLKAFEKLGLQAEESPALRLFFWSISCEGEEILPNLGASQSS